MTRKLVAIAAAAAAAALLQGCFPLAATGIGAGALVATDRRTTGIDSHHDTLRYGWELVGPDGTVVAIGLDVGVLADDGRLRRVNGFLGPLPEEASA